MTPADAGARVARGAAVLDARGPAGWREKVRMAVRSGRLDMLDPCGCVLGRVYPMTDEDFGYAVGLDALVPRGKSRRAWSQEHGFSADRPGDYDALEGAWARLLGAEAVRT